MQHAIQHSRDLAPNPRLFFPTRFFPLCHNLAGRLALIYTSKEVTTIKMSQRIAIVSVFDKTGLLDLAKGLVKQNVRILASGGTAKMIRESGFAVE